MGDSRTLYVGADDSNNHNTQRSKVLAAVFSFNQDDSVFKNLPDTQEKEELDEWLAQQQNLKGFRYALLTEPYFFKMQPILPLAIPPLIRDYYNNFKEEADRVWVCIDGPLPKEHKDYVRQALGGLFEEVIVTNNIKRRNERARSKKQERLHSPLVLKMAHICAYHIYADFSREHLEGRVQINQADLRDLFVRLRRRP